VYATKCVNLSIVLIAGTAVYQWFHFVNRVFASSLKMDQG